MMMNRRDALGCLAAAGVSCMAPFARAAVPKPYDWSASPPMTGKDDFIAWMVANRGEDPKYLGRRWDKFQDLLHNRDVWGERDKRAYLMTPREEFVTAKNLEQAYNTHFLDIGFGVTITGPHSVARMTNTLDISRGEKVLEIGTGSGYQSAYLSNLTSKVWSVEIIKPLAERTWALYDRLIAGGYSEFAAITHKHADGYYGWEEAAPFDKIIVTCGIDHVPPPLLQQLKPNGIMCIPVGPPGAQHVLKIVKEADGAGGFKVARSDIYNGAIVNFVPFTKLDGDAIKGTHNN
jgi:protein-L-isoaspartate(D-aspartate) O-methyltransferase